MVIKDREKWHEYRHKVVQELIVASELKTDKVLLQAIENVRYLIGQYEAYIEQLEDMLFKEKIGGRQICR